MSFVLPYAYRNNPICRACICQAEFHDDVFHCPRCKLNFDLKTLEPELAYETGDEQVCGEPCGCLRDGESDGWRHGTCLLLDTHTDDHYAGCYWTSAPKGAAR